MLILENPGLRGQSRITHSLYAGLQLILPGEVAPAHRHSQSALRFIVRRRGRLHRGRRRARHDERRRLRHHAVVDLARPRQPVATSRWCGWTASTFAIVEMLDAQFIENGPRGIAAARPRTEGESICARSATPCSRSTTSRRRRTSPLFWYPYERTREALATLARSDAPHPCYGYKLQFTNPATGGWPMPTIGTFMQLLPKGFRGKPYRSTDSHRLLGRRGQRPREGRRRDVRLRPEGHFVVPSWMPTPSRPMRKAVLFCFSDRPVQDVLDLWREQEG